jgi:hypothetical protein
MPDEVKQAEELLALGGYFYTLNGQAWCDTPTASWRLQRGVGYVRVVED